MKQLLHGRIALLTAACLLLGAGWVLGQQAGTSEKTLMHAFAFTPAAKATPADFDAFYKATADLVGKVPGLKRVWVGKLRVNADLGLTPETGAAQAPKREYGVAMEFDDAKALADYGQHPAHETWERAYRRVREPGTTTFDIVGQ